MSNLENLVKKAVLEQLRKELPHTCFTCKHFHFAVVDGVEQEGKGNRNCWFDGSIKVEDGVCQMWMLQLDPRKRKPSFVSYYRR